MRKFSAYSLLEVLLVMSIIILILGVGIASYMSLAEATRFNEDVANLEHDILLTQRASMLLKRAPNERWLYGIGIDLSKISEGKYTFFKWCSPYNDFGNDDTRAPVPTKNGTVANLPLSSVAISCPKNPSVERDELLYIEEYGVGKLNLRNKISTGSVSYILFESVSGKAFMYNAQGGLINQDLNIVFNRSRGRRHTLNVKQFSGRTKLLLNSQ